MINIILYEDRYAADFKRLNLEWLDKYNLTESHDLMVLNDPRGTIIDRGGIIYLAQAGDEIVGSAALMKEGEGEYEFAKMAVTPEWQGKGISRLLIDQCMQTARDWKVKKLSLFSNSQLKTAISLYEKYGFRHVKVEHSPFATADVKMELEMEG
ncbi:GNAT family N-acetyltransferase [Paraflavitalea sp. CAU 1676]|uniref:GNAT family N-acetyltransferase n=1 Tax=Paraflavitalea sp. CAU 1676 TaxID=3032598 RepID=UPI0023D9DF8B|nr:GNAT family N-acetyltransferase [Paraflavitalea sp. CAU 1676]MDF2192834.1 GNAT family N-acetyltransferase [Paraflavitalea sp. CAU 1676]